MFQKFQEPDGKWLIGKMPPGAKTAEIYLSGSLEGLGEDAVESIRKALDKAHYTARVDLAEQLLQPLGAVISNGGREG
jgi:hypothetical protein